MKKAICVTEKKHMFSGGGGGMVLLLSSTLRRMDNCIMIMIPPTVPLTLWNGQIYPHVTFQALCPLEHGFSSKEVNGTV